MRRVMDWLLEFRIYLAFHSAVRRGDSGSWAYMNALVAKRSADQVARMERERGLV